MNQQPCRELAGSLLPGPLRAAQKPLSALPRCQDAAQRRSGEVGDQHRSLGHHYGPRRKPKPSPRSPSIRATRFSRQVGQLRSVGGCRPRPATGINLSQRHPATQRLRVNPGFIPSWAPIRAHAPGRLGASLRASNVIRIARSRSSSGYFLGAGLRCSPSRFAVSIKPGTRQVVPARWVPILRRAPILLRGWTVLRPQSN